MANVYIGIILDMTSVLLYESQCITNVLTCQTEVSTIPTEPFYYTATKCQAFPWQTTCFTHVEEQPQES